jgi:hypothetical protein
MRQPQRGRLIRPELSRRFGKHLSCQIGSKLAFSGEVYSDDIARPVILVARVGSLLAAFVGDMIDDVFILQNGIFSHLCRSQMVRVHSCSSKTCIGAGSKPTFVLQEQHS